MLGQLSQFLWSNLPWLCHVYCYDFVWLIIIMQTSAVQDRNLCECCYLVNLKILCTVYVFHIFLVLCLADVNICGLN